MPTSHTNSRPRSISSKLSFISATLIFCGLILSSALCLVARVYDAAASLTAVAAPALTRCCMAWSNGLMVCLLGANSSASSSLDSTRRWPARSGWAPLPLQTRLGVVALHQRTCFPCEISFFRAASELPDCTTSICTCCGAGCPRRICGLRPVARVHRQGVPMAIR